MLRISRVTTIHGIRLFLQAIMRWADNSYTLICVMMPLCLINLPWGNTPRRIGINCSILQVRVGPLPSSFVGSGRCSSSRTTAWLYGASFPRRQCRPRGSRRIAASCLLSSTSWRCRICWDDRRAGRWGTPARHSDHNAMRNVAQSRRSLTCWPPRLASMGLPCPFRISSPAHAAAPWC